MAWEENSCICLNMQLIAILSRTGVRIGTSLNRDVNSLFLFIIAIVFRFLIMLILILTYLPYTYTH